MKIVIKVGTGVLTRENGTLDGSSIVHLVSALAGLMQQGHQVVLVSSGAVGAGVSVLGLPSYPQELSLKQACAAVGQTRLMQAYENLFNHFNVDVAQLLLTAEDLKLRRRNVQATVLRLFEHGGIIPIVNENDTVATYEIEIGDNDTLSAIVAALIDADLLILLSDIDGLYTDDPRQNPEAEFIEQVDELTDEFMNMGKATTGSNVGTGGMNTKMIAAKIATSSDVDMIIANSKDIGVLHRLLSGENEGTLFVAHKDEIFDLPEFVQNLHKNQ